MTIIAEYVEVETGQGADGANTLEAITCALNERGVRTARGTRWYGSSVANLLRVRKSSPRFLPLDQFYRREISEILVAARPTADMA